MVGRTHTLARRDDAITVEVGPLTVAREGGAHSALMDNCDAGRAESVAGWIGGDGCDSSRRIQVRGKKQVVLAAREPWAEDRHRPAARGLDARWHDQGE